MDGNPETAGVDLRRSQGDGFYVQAGYLLHPWQPWLAYERWQSDAPGEKGSYDLYRVGFTYFIKGHHANIKAGYEHVDADSDIGASSETTIDSFVAGLFLDY